jgi:hypothetical protein
VGDVNGSLYSNCLSDINWEKLSILLGETNTEISRYDGFLKGMPNPEILLSALARKKS